MALGTQLGFPQVSDWIEPRRRTILGFAAGLAGGRTPQQGIALGLQGAAQGREADDAWATTQKAEQERQAQLNQTIQFLQQSHPDLAGMVESGMPVGEAWSEALKRMQPGYGEAGGGPDAPASVREWEYFNALDPEQQGAYLRMKRANPYLDIGTGFVQPNPVVPGQVAGPAIAKENYGEAYDTASGAAQGKVDVETAAHAPKAVANAEAMIANIDAVINDPNLDWAVGLGGMLPAIPNTAQAGTVARIEQLQGAAFLQAFETLKGGGQITEVEGKKATDAIARLNRAQSKQDFVQALNDLKSVIQVGLERARQHAGAARPGGQTSTGLQWSIE